LPFDLSPEGERYARGLFGMLSAQPRFLVYGWDRQVLSWSRWLAARPELSGWHNRRLGPFGDVEVILFEKDAGSGSNTLAPPYNGKRLLSWKI